MPTRETRHLRLRYCRSDVVTEGWLVGRGVSGPYRRGMLIRALECRFDGSGEERRLARASLLWVALMVA